MWDTTHGQGAVAHALRLPFAQPSIPGGLLHTGALGEDIKGLAQQGSHLLVSATLSSGHTNVLPPRGRAAHHLRKPMLKMLIEA